MASRRPFRLRSSPARTANGNQGNWSSGKNSHRRMAASDTRGRASVAPSPERPAPVPLSASGPVAACRPLGPATARIGAARRARMRASRCRAPCGSGLTARRTRTDGGMAASPDGSRRGYDVPRGARTTGSQPAAGRLRTKETMRATETPPSGGKKYATHRTRRRPPEGSTANSLGERATLGLGRAVTADRRATWSGATPRG